jgi:hypothetical protein
VNQLALSARAYHRVLKVSRPSRLASSETMRRRTAEALQYRRRGRTSRRAGARCYTGWVAAELRSIEPRGDNPGAAARDLQRYRRHPALSSGPGRCCDLAAGEGAAGGADRARCKGCLVSGRRLRLRDELGLDGVAYAGNHGLHFG